MTEKKDPPKPPKFIDNPLAPDVFASWHQGLSARHGNIHATFVTDRYNHETNEPSFVVIGRLVMPIAGAREFAHKLVEFLKQIESSPPPISEPPRTLQ